MGFVVGAAATVGVTAMQERGVSGAAEDVAIRAEINHLWQQRPHEEYMRLTLQVHEGRVLVAGALPDATARAEAIQLAWKASGVREVINEVQVVPSIEVPRWVRDQRTVLEIDSRLTFTREIDSINYSVEVVNGVVFLLGIARDRDELDRVLAVIRDTPHVRRIANHVMLREDPRRTRPARA